MKEGLVIRKCEAVGIRLAADPLKIYEMALAVRAPSWAAAEAIARARIRAMLAEQGLTPQTDMDFACFTHDLLGRDTEGWLQPGTKGRAARQPHEMLREVLPT